jgi:hypothetical protein
MMRASHLKAAVLVAVAVTASAFFAGQAIAGATIVIENNDGPGEGFNDATPWTPRGGNPATTLGQARLNAFQYAADLWSGCINSSVTIVVRAQMDPLTCNATSAVLGWAGTTFVFRDFVGAPRPGTYYPSALTNELAGLDMRPSDPDINATFNSNLNGDAGCLGGAGWYYGYDGNPPGNDIDFITVVMHEIGHGLGFQTFVDLPTGTKLNGYDDAYMLYLNRAGVSPGDFPDMSNSARVAASISDPDLRWVGPSVTAAHPYIPITSGLNGGYVRVHAPNPLESGSSVSHFSKAVAPNEVMEPAYTGPDHDPSLALYVLDDIGWTLEPACLPCPPDPTTIANTDTSTVARTATLWFVRVELSNLGPGDAAGVNATMTENLPWLTITDADGAYGDIPSGASSDGSTDFFTLDLTSWPGGSFDVGIDVTWTDGCGNDYSDSFTQTLQPPAFTAVAFEQVDAAPVDNAIEVRWKLFADEPFVGFNLYRRSDEEAFEIRLNTGGPIDPGRRSYADDAVDPGVVYHYSVAVVMPDGSEKRSPSVEASLGTNATSLEQNRPNPFNPLTQIGYRIAGDTRVILRIYDVSGALVRTLVDAPQASGVYTVSWNGRDDSGRDVSTGLYFYRLEAGKFTQTRRMVLLK